jgi:hypothetical protein
MELLSVSATDIVQSDEQVIAKFVADILYPEEYFGLYLAGNHRMLTPF